HRRKEGKRRWEREQRPDQPQRYPGPSLPPEQPRDVGRDEPHLPEPPRPLADLPPPPLVPLQRKRRPGHDLRVERLRQRPREVLVARGLEEQRRDPEHREPTAHGRQRSALPRERREEPEPAHRGVREAFGARPR